MQHKDGAQAEEWEGSQCRVKEHTRRSAERDDNKVRGPEQRSSLSQLEKGRNLKGSTGAEEKGKGVGSRRVWMRALSRRGRGRRARGQEKKEKDCYI